VCSKWFEFVSAIQKARLGEILINHQRPMHAGRAGPMKAGITEVLRGQTLCSAKWTPLLNRGRARSAIRPPNPSNKLQGRDWEDQTPPHKGARHQLHNNTIIFKHCLIDYVSAFWFQL